MPVNDVKAEYKKFAPKWKRARDVAAGSDEVKAAGELYLPKLKAQTTDQYKAYVTRATFYNATYRVVAAMLGMLYRKPPTKDIPASLDSLLENINLHGDNLLTFATKVSYELDVVGRVGLLNDHTRRPEGYATLTKAVAEQLGFRATVQLYSAESIINWRTRVVNNKTMLSLAVLQEDVVEADPKDKFKDNHKKQYRVLELDESGYYTVTVYEQKDGKDVIVQPTFHPLIDNSPLTEIPFYICGPSGLQIEPEEPPMIDLIDLNLAHYRVSASYEHGCHFTGLPTPYVAGGNVSVENDGKEPAKFYVGSETIMVFADPQAKMAYGEFSGQGLTALEKNLDRKESQMAILGARMLAPEKKTAETATTAAIHRTGENAILSSIALTTSEVLSKALTLMAKWSGFGDKKCSYNLNRDFMPFTLDAPFLMALVQAYLQGTLPYESFFEILQRGDLVNGEMTVEEAMKAIEDDKTKRAAQAADAAGQLADATGGPELGAPGKKPPAKS